MIEIGIIHDVAGVDANPQRVNVAIEDWTVEHISGAFAPDAVNVIFFGKEHCVVDVYDGTRERLERSVVVWL